MNRTRLRTQKWSDDCLVCMWLLLRFMRSEYIILSKEHATHLESVYSFMF